MIGYTHTYLTTQEIIEKSLLFTFYQNYTILGGAILMSIVSFILIYYVFPFFDFFYEYRVEKQRKHDNKALMKQILLQKEVEDEIEKEL